MNIRIAIPYEDGNIFTHFGKAVRFKFYTVADDQVTASEVADADGVGHEELALWLVQHEVSAVICDNIGPGAQGALMAAGIMALAGVNGSADDAIDRLIAGKLEATSAATCSHHAHGRCHSHCGGSCHGCCH